MSQGTLSPIPKCANNSLEVSDNYRQIAAISSIVGKLVDRIIIAKEGTALISSDLQFAYKKGFSTS